MMARLGRNTLLNLLRSATNRTVPPGPLVLPIVAIGEVVLTTSIQNPVDRAAGETAIVIDPVPAPEQDGDWIRSIIRAITAHSQDVMSGDLTSAGDGLFFDAHLDLRGTTFVDDRQDYMAPLQVALLRVSDDWAESEFTLLQDDAADVYEMGSEYLARF